MQRSNSGVSSDEAFNLEHVWAIFSYLRQHCHAYARRKNFEILSYLVNERRELVQTKS